MERLLKTLIVACWLVVTGCKTLEDKCAERFPPSLDRMNSLQHLETQDPPKVIYSYLDCPEFAQTLPKGKKVIIAEDKAKGIQLTAMRDPKTDSLKIEATSMGDKTTNIKQVSKEREVRTITPAKEKKGFLQKLGDLILDFFWLILAIIIIITIIIGYIHVRRHYYNSYTKRKRSREDSI